MTRLAPRILLSAILLCAAISVASDLPSNMAEGFDFAPDRTAPIDIQADHFSSESNGWVVAWGNVLIRQGTSQMTADRVSVNQKTGDIVADGNVIYIREGQGATRTEHFVYNFKSQQGITPKIDVQSGVLRVISERTRRNPDGSYLLHDTLVTTCTNEPSALHWFAHGNRATYYPREYVVLDDMTLHLGGTPIFYFPWWKRSFADHYGWRFLPGYESDWGGYLLSTYKRPLAVFEETYWTDPNYSDSNTSTNIVLYNGVDSSTHIDYRTERGFALGEDLSWHFGPANEREHRKLIGDNEYQGPAVKDGVCGHMGWIGVYGIFDDNPMDKDYDRDSTHDIAEDNRYRVTVRHDSFLTPADFLTLRSSYLSDSYVFPDFYEDEYEALVQPESYAAYTHTGEGYGFGAGFYHRANEFYESINRMPELWGDVLRTEIGSSPFYYESQSSGGFIQREFADYDSYGTNGVKRTVPDSYDSLRIDSRQAIYLVEKLGFVNFMPRAVYRGTYYGTTKNMRTEKYVSATSTNVLTRTITEDADADLRNIFELGAESSFRAYGYYLDSTNGILRHVVEPYVNYTYVPEPNLRPTSIYQFDAVDRLDKANNVRVGVKQYVQRNINDVIINLIDADLYAIYDIENAEGESELRTLGTLSTFRPTQSIRIEIDSQYYVPENEFSFIDFWMALWSEDRWEAAGEVYYRPEECTLFTGSIKFSFNEYWDINFYGRYDSEISRLEEVAAYLQYNLDCLSFRFRTSYEPAFTRDDGTEREAKIKLALYVWLRAYTPARYERRLRDGYF